MTSLNTVSILFGGTAPHGLKELYGETFSGGGSAPASGAINLLAFNNKTPSLVLAASVTTSITSTINPSPLSYTTTNTSYTINIAGRIGPQVSSTAQNSVRGIDVHPNDQVTMKVYDSQYTGYSQIRFWGNHVSAVQGSVNRSENNTFNNRYKPVGGYNYVTAANIFNAQAVVSWYIPMPVTVTSVEFYHTKTQSWDGFSITIT